MRKVLFIATVKTHIEAFHLPYLKWFHEQGWETSVCAKSDVGERGQSNRIQHCDKYYNIPLSRNPFCFDNIRAYNRLKQIIDDNDYDVVHCHTPVGGALGRLACRKARKKSLKVIYTAHGFHFYKGAPIVNWLLYYPIEKWLAHYTDVLITINNEDYKRARKFKCSQVVNIPGIGVSIEKYFDTYIKKDDKLTEIGIPANAFLLFSVGELNKNKNHEIIIRTIAEIGNERLHYAIAGKGPLKARIHDLAKKLDVAGQIHLLDYRTDVNELYKAADIFVFPSLREGLPVSVMEAMASGLPCLVSDIRGNKDLIEGGKGGYLYAPKDHRGFSVGILQLYCDAALRQQMGLFNQNKVKTYDIKKTMAIMKKIYEQKFSDIIVKL